MEEIINEIRLSGKRYFIWLVHGCTHRGNDYAGYVEGHGPSYVFTWQQLSGSARVIDDEQESVTLFNFLTIQSDHYWPEVGKGRNLMESVLAVADRSDGGAIAPFALAESVDQKAVVDLFAEEILALVRASEEEGKLPIPMIVLPLLVRRRLIELGLIAEPETRQVQLALA